MLVFSHILGGPSMCLLQTSTDSIRSLSKTLVKLMTKVICPISPVPCPTAHVAVVDVTEEEELDADQPQGETYTGRFQNTSHTTTVG
jgi:hypothetical protein